jgi:Flp pilus assembly pilin Flp
MPTFLRRLTENQRGVTAVEYTMIVAAISLATIVGITTAGEAMNSLFGTISDTLS